MVVQILYLREFKMCLKVRGEEYLQVCVSDEAKVYMHTLGVPWLGSRPLQ